MMIEPTTKQETALALRRKGLTWAQIGQEIGCSSRNAEKHALVALLKEQRATRKAKGA